MRLSLNRLFQTAKAPTINCLWLLEFVSTQMKHTQIILDVKGGDNRYDLHSEQHIYRILQQACENALQHARATTIIIRGTIDPLGVDLTVEDNGVGFPFSGELDVTTFTEADRLGIAGMFQRANIIHASLTIDSAAEQGTRIHLKWQR